MNWCVYIISNDRATYVGASPDPYRRLRQHNQEICGGAKYTKSRGPNWTLNCIISGLDKIAALQLEWAIKNCPPKRSHGLKSRISKMYSVLNREKFTKNSLDSNTFDLVVQWIDTSLRNETQTLPHYIKEIITPFENKVYIDDEIQES